MAWFRRLWDRLFRKRPPSIQVIISLSFTAVAVVGILFLSLSLYWRFSSEVIDLEKDNTQRILTQVNLSLDDYLHQMMQISDTVYYNLIKPSDLLEDELTSYLTLIYEENSENVVSISVFDQAGQVV